MNLLRILTYGVISGCFLAVAPALAVGRPAAANASTPVNQNAKTTPEGGTFPSNSKRMKLISRGVPAYASSGNAQAANSGEYRSGWRSSGVPATLTYDLSSVPSSSRQV